MQRRPAVVDDRRGTNPLGSDGSDGDWLLHSKPSSRLVPLLGASVGAEGGGGGGGVSLLAVLVILAPALLSSPPVSLGGSTCAQNKSAVVHNGGGADLLGADRSASDWSPGTAGSRGDRSPSIFVSLRRGVSSVAAPSS